jgi:hypothetical protein
MKSPKIPAFLQANKIKRLASIFKRTVDPSKAVLCNVEIKNKSMTYTNGCYLVAVGVDAEPGLYSVLELCNRARQCAPHDSAIACFEGVAEFGAIGQQYPNWESVIPDYDPLGPNTGTATLQVDYLLDILNAAKVSGLPCLEITIQGSPAGDGHSTQAILIKRPADQDLQSVDFTAVLMPVRTKYLEQT